MKKTRLRGVNLDAMKVRQQAQEVRGIRTIHAFECAYDQFFNMLGATTTAPSNAWHGMASGWTETRQ